MVSEELASFIESGVTILVGSRDQRLVPECMRALGVRVEPGREELTLFLPAATSAVTVANLLDNGRVAACFTRTEDHRSIQVKGSLVRLADADESDRAAVSAYRPALARNLGFVGLPARTTFRLAHWPCHAVRMRVESVFVQTPGPGAGDRLATAGAAR